MSNSDVQKQHGITIGKRRTSEDLLHDSGPYAQFLRNMVRIAHHRGASDIHLEPTEQGVAIRLRIDGSIALYREIGLAHRESLILEAKRIFGLSIGISGRPQDGRASLPTLGLDLRVSLLPTHFGEKIVMRLLNLKSTFSLDGLGLRENELSALVDATRFDDGVVIVSGPTGSGKTKTLYSMLNFIDASNFNIVTLEDPIEYRLEGLNQVQVSSKMTFADALRSVLRQDPDVILVGEVRDEETAKLCFQAAETGHLVLTTLHANGALEVVERLRGLGITELSLRSNLRMSIAQRLEQKLCPTCRLPVTASPSSFGGLHSECLKVRGPGCATCTEGILGRIPILEWATSNGRDPAKEFDVQQSLKESRLQRILTGEIDCKEDIHAS